MANTLTESDMQEFLSSGFIFGLRSGRTVIGWGEFKKSQTPEGACSVYAPDFYLEDPKPWLIPPRFAVVDRKLFATHVLPKLTTEVKDFRWSEPPRSSFDEQFTKIQNAFQSSGLAKAVPVVHATSQVTVSKESLSRILVALEKLPESLTAYGFWANVGSEDSTEGVLGATPEYLFSVEGRELRTMALAGTRSKIESADGAAALMADPKERREHQLVIDDIHAVLSKFGNVVIGQTSVAELPTLFHLKTPISVEMREAVDFESLANALHPTPALGLSPRSLGVEFLKNWDEVKKRGRFGAPFGIELQLEDGSRVQDCVVGIRNIQWGFRQQGVGNAGSSKDCSVQLGSGCGIIPQSEPNREWAELQLKRDSVRKILGV